MPEDGQTRRLRVLTLIDTIAGLGGAEMLAARAAARLDPARFESFFCTSRATGGQLAAELAGAGVHVLDLGRRSRKQITGWRPLVQLLRRERIDVIHAHKFGSNVWGTLVGSIARVPVIVAHEHSWAGEEGRLRRLLDRWLIARGADAFVAVSAEDRRRMIELEGISASQIRLIPNGIPTLPPADPGAIRHELGISPTAPVIGAIGRLSPVKALDVLIEAAALLRSGLPDLRVLLVGRGAEEDRLRRLAAARGVEDVVLLLGERVDVSAVLAALDVAATCSDSEGIPLAVLEYMAAGLPVVATRVGGLPELVQEGVNGFLVPPRDPSALADALGRLLADPALRAELGRAGRERQQREFDLDVVVRRFEDLYVDLYERTRRGRAESRRGPR